MMAELCNSFLLSNTKRGLFQRVGEITELAVFVAKSIYENIFFKRNSLSRLLINKSIYVQKSSHCKHQGQSRML